MNNRTIVNCSDQKVHYPKVTFLIPFGRSDSQNFYVKGSKRSFQVGLKGGVAKGYKCVHSVAPFLVQAWAGLKLSILSRILLLGSDEFEPSWPARAIA